MAKPALPWAFTGVIDFGNRNFNWVVRGLMNRSASEDFGLGIQWKMLRLCLGWF